MEWLNTVNMRNEALCDSKLLLFRVELKNISFRMKPFAVFLMHFMQLPHTPFSRASLSLFWWGGGKQNGRLCRINSDTQRLPGHGRSKEFLYLAWGMATFSEAHERICFIYYYFFLCCSSEMQESFTHSCLFSFQIIPRLFGCVSYYSGAEEREKPMYEECLYLD